jgi:CRISPR-associated protein Csm2
MSLKIPTLNENGQSVQVNGKDHLILNPLWITNKDGIESDAVDFAEYFGKYLAGVDNRREGMTTTQIRNFFGEIRKIQMKTVAKSKGDFAMLKPRMAIAKVRATKDNSNNRIKDFERSVVLFYDKIEKNTDQTEQQFQNFADFIEAVVAYHKAYGGKN